MSQPNLEGDGKLSYRRYRKDSGEVCLALHDADGTLLGEYTSKDEFNAAVSARLGVEAHQWITVLGVIRVESDLTDADEYEPARGGWGGDRMWRGPRESTSEAQVRERSDSDADHGVLMLTDVQVDGLVSQLYRRCLAELDELLPEHRRPS